MQPPAVQGGWSPPEVVPLRGVKRRRGRTTVGKCGRELRRLCGALLVLASDPCPLHLRSRVFAPATIDHSPFLRTQLQAGAADDVPGCTCGEQLVEVVAELADREALDVLDGFLAAPGAPWLSPSVHAVRSLCEGKLYEAGRSLPLLATTGTKAELVTALRRVRDAWAAGARWLVYARRGTNVATIEQIAGAMSEGATCELERRELAATVRTAGRLA